MAFRGRFLKMRERVAGYVISWWTFFRWIGDEVIKSQHHQPPGSSRSGAYVLVASRQLTSSIWWGFRSLQNSSKDLAQNIISSLWGGTKGPWLCLRAKLSIFCPAWLLSFCIFSRTLITFFGTRVRARRLKFSYRQEAGGGHGWGEVSVLGRPP